MRSALTWLLLSLSAVLAPQVNAGTNRWTPIGPEGAAILALAPAPAVPGLIYAVTGACSTNVSLECAVFRSRDSGLSWEARSFEVPAELIAGLVADPLDANRLYLVGRPLLASSDGGASWRPLLRRGGFPFVGLVVDREAPQRLFALHGSHRVFFSADRGASWQLRTDGLPAGAAATALLGNPHNAKTLYAAGAAGVFKTVDRGLHWAPSGLRIATTLLALAHSRPETLYAYTAGPALYRTENGGASWTELPDPQSFDRVFSLLVHPTDPRRVLARTDAGLYESRNAGEDWAELAGDVPGGLDNESTDRLVADPFDGERLYTGLADRLGRSTNFGASRSSRHRGLSHRNVWALAASPGNDVRLYAASSLVHHALPTLWKSRDLGFSWRPRVPDEVAYTSAVAIDPTDFRHVVVAGRGPSDDFRFSETHDGGENWQLLAGPEENIRHMSFALRDPRRVFAVSFSKLYRSTDGGTHWQESGDGLPEPCDTLVCSSFHRRKVISSPHAASTVYLLFDGGIFRSSDGGESWSRWGESLPNFTVWDLIADPTRPGRFYAATERGPYLTRDGGVSWQQRAGGLPERPDLPGAREVQALALDPLAPSQLLAVAFDGRVFRSHNGGVSWSSASQGLLAGLRPADLFIHPSETGAFLLSTEVGGLYHARFTH